MKDTREKKLLAPEKFRAQLNLLNDAARRVLSTGFGRKMPADRILAAYFRENRRCGSRDRAFISETVYSALRYWGFLREYLPSERRDELESGSVKMTAKELSALLMSACFISGDLNNASAIVSAANLPALPRALNNPCARANQMAGYFNCTVRLTDSMLIPQWIDELLPADLDKSSYLQMLASRPPVWIRLQCNDPQEVINELRCVDAEAEFHPVLPNAVRVRSKVNLYSLESFRAGKFEIQDLASQCVSITAAPKPGERWLDPCAGAGGKTLHLAQLMMRKGSVQAGDIREEKLNDLRLRARRAGFPNITAKAHNGGVWKGKHLFDGVLLDAPCSCSGVWRRNPGAQWKLSPEDLKELSATQSKIMENYAASIRIGGVMVYATCSLFDMENSAVVKEFLARHDEYKLDPFEHPLTGKIVPGMLRIDSVDGDCDALFMAKMRKVK
ncbi:MAG: RsmB/NOP family class I SAM-dependent RNA methyltransferase [Lentisphaeria bacterium]|nr:RsmB/NOP family class I SAM-dependent RNA methyltransferase [Lentisphaeria bacterium]